MCQGQPPGLGWGVGLLELPREQGYYTYLVTTDVTVVVEYNAVILLLKDTLAKGYLSNKDKIIWRQVL